MLHQRETVSAEKPAFKWGAKTGIGVTNRETKFYDSFTCDGVEFRLFDCAWFYRTGDCETSIGKLVKMFETRQGEKKVRVVWFFRPSEIRGFLGGYEPRWNELFLASGEGPGLSNVNDVQAIVQKCTVLCTSHDPRNPQPSGDELRMADYVFSRTFDVKNLVISGAFGDVIAGTKVEHFFNKTNGIKLISGPSSSRAPDSSFSSGKSFSSGPASAKSSNNVLDNGKSTRTASQFRKGIELKEGTGQVHKPKVIPDLDASSRRLVRPQAKTRSVQDILCSEASEILQPAKKMKLLNNKSSSDESDDSASRPPEKIIDMTNLEIPKIPDTVDKRSWFKKLPFDDRLKDAKEEGTLVLIENLDPSFTSLDVKDLCRQAFRETVDAKMIQPSLLSGPYDGKAFVIFKSKGAADSALSLLTERCLMLANGRPVIGSREFLMKTESCKAFIGHFMLDKARLDHKDAVSTSHCSQPNNFEYLMAMEWRALQAKRDLMWQKLYEEQSKEIDSERNRLRT